MEKNEKKSASRKISVLEDGGCPNTHEDEVLELDELFGVQGGINVNEEHEHEEDTCGLGCYNMNILIKGGNEKR